jgi:hypothetical protein
MKEPIIAKLGKVAITAWTQGDGLCGIMGGLIGFACTQGDIVRPVAVWGMDGFGMASSSGLDKILIDVGINIQNGRVTYLVGGFMYRG